MAKHEGTHHKGHEEHMRRHGGHVPKERAKGGPAAIELEEEKKEHERKRGGDVKRRKAGGHVGGMHEMRRPDRRARGGATSDQDPLTSANKMSAPSYESVGAKPNGGGKGPDRD